MALFWRNSQSQDGIMNYKGGKELGQSYAPYSTTDCTPVVSLSLGNSFYVVFKEFSTGSLFCRRGQVNHIAYPTGIYLYGSFAYSLNTNVNAKNPSIVVNKGINPTFHLVWESPGTVNSTDILYGTFSGNDLTGVTNISTGNGYPINYAPCISLANNNLVVSWTGYWDSHIWKVTNPDVSLYRKKAIVRVKSSSGWSGTFTELGDNVNYVNNNSVNTSAEKSVFVWSEGSTSVSKWIKRTSGVFYNIHNLSHSGIQHQVSTGSDFNTMTSMVFNANQLPYYFIKSTSDFNIAEEQQGELNKITAEDSIITFGRSGIVNKSGVEFVFNIGDVSVGDSVIRFVSYPDTILISSISDMNVQSKTEVFYLNPSTPFYFSDMYYVIRQELADTALTEQDIVNFKVELVKALNGEVIGTFDIITYNKNNLGKYANMNYQVDCSGIQPGDYYLRLVTTSNGDGEYSLSDIKRNSLELEKSNYSVISFFGENLPVTYELSQNYPNPFNPTTKIKYQMPVDGMVTLKVYDILGAEIATLVEEEKTAGRYEVNFNASSLASGVYIYRLQANDFVNVKKMVLLK